MHPRDHSSNTQPGLTPMALDDARVLDLVASYLTPEEASHVERALTCARAARRPAPNAARAAAGGPPRGPSGFDADLAHGQALAEILADTVHAGAILIASALLVPLVEQGWLTLETIRRRLRAAHGAAIATLIGRVLRLRETGAMTRISALPEHGPAHGPGHGPEPDATLADRAAPGSPGMRPGAGPFREWLAATENDPRVLVLHLAERLHRMRVVHQTFDAHRAPRQAVALPLEWSVEECRSEAHDTEHRDAPVAGRLGMSRLECELRDHAFAILKPARYHWIRDLLEVDQDAWNAYVERVRDVIRHQLADHDIQAEVSGRVKSVSSIHRKMRRTHTIDRSQLNDLLAVRIVVPTVEACWDALAQVHSIWPPFSGRPITNYIDKPKRNGYQSLHSTVTCLDDREVEIQVRTPDMHHVAEFGMHWVYKQFGDDSGFTFPEAQEHADRVVRWQDQIRHARPAPNEHLAEVPRQSAAPPSVIVTTKDGARRSLPKGATALDFAYDIHTDLGHRCAEIRVLSTSGGPRAGNQRARVVPLDYPLRQGDIVEIITRDDARPTHAWLDYASTQHARDRILRYLRSRDGDTSFRRGRDRLNRELRLLDPPRAVDDLSDDELQSLASACGRRNADSLLVAIGGFDLPTGTLHRHVLERFGPPATGPAAPTPTTPPDAPERRDPETVDLSGVYAQLAQCCEPLPGDELTGYVARGGYLAIHRSACANLHRSLADRPDQRVDLGTNYRLDAGREGYRITIEIACDPRADLLADLAAAIAHHGAVVEVISDLGTPDAILDRAALRAAVRVRDPRSLAALMTGLRSVRGVLSVQRRPPPGDSTRSERSAEAAADPSHDHVRARPKRPSKARPRLEETAPKPPGEHDAWTKRSTSSATATRRGRRPTRR